MKLVVYGPQKRLAYLPAGNWYDFFTSQRFTGGQTITWTNADQTQTPLFVREAARFAASINALSVIDGFCDARNCSNTGSPCTPVPGHCVCSRACGHKLYFSIAVNWRSMVSTGALVTVPSAAALYADRPRAAWSTT